MKINIARHQSGVVLLVTLLLTGVLLAVGASLLTITLKQFQLSNIAYTSEVAFQAANAGMECVLYYDFPKTGASPFSVGSTVSSKICMGVSSPASVATGNVDSGEEQRYQFSWGNPAVCSEVSIYKYYSTTAVVNYTVNGESKTCPQYSECTVVQARGYNVGCAAIGSSAKVVEREYTQIY